MRLLGDAGIPVSPHHLIGSGTEPRPAALPFPGPYVVKLADVTEIPAAEATRIFPAYLDAAEKLVRFVDGWKA